MKRAKAGTVDLERVRAARAELQRLLAEHPHLRGEPGADNRAGWAAQIEGMEAEAMAENDKQTAIRLPAELLERIDRLAERWRAERPGMRMTRSDVLRVLVLEGLERAEAAPGRGER